MILTTEQQQYEDDVNYSHHAIALGINEQASMVQISFRFCHFDQRIYSKKSEILIGFDFSSRSSLFFYHFGLFNQSFN